jgi:hypothetical protein
VIDYSLVKLMHRHDDGWAALEPIDEGGTRHHDPASHDPERDAKSWVRRYRCTKCAEEVALGTGDAGTEPR